VAISIWYSKLSFEKAISITTTIESLCLIPFCLFYFFELLTTPCFLKLTEVPSFWVTTGILFLFISITPYYLAYEYFKKNNIEMETLDFFGYDLLIAFLAKASLTTFKHQNDPSSSIIY
jgi:hypothetical protein